MASMFERMAAGMGLATLPRVKPYKEMGASGAMVSYGHVRTNETNSQLVGPEKYKTFANIIANTTTVAAGMRYFLNLISRPSWQFKPADETDAAQRAADFLQEVIENLETPWSNVVRSTGTYRFYGFSIQEWTAIKRDDGKIGLKDIERRPQYTITRWEMDEQGAIEGCWQREPIAGRELGLPRGKLFYVVDDTLSDSPEGLGLLRHVVDPANRLKEYLTQEGMGFMRDLQGIPMGRAPLAELRKRVAAGEMTQAQMDQAVDNLKDFVGLERKSNKTSLVLDSEPYLNQSDTANTFTGNPLWNIELLSGSAPGLGQVGAAIMRLNQEMARILGTEGMLLGADSAGSFALSKEKNSNLYLLANSVLRDIRLQAQKDIVWPIWSLNGFPEELMPELGVEDVQPKDVEQLARVLRELGAAGAPIAPDDEVQNFIRDLLGVPAADLEKLARQAELAQTANMGFPGEEEAPVEDDDDETAATPT
jgi:hypothetical protein